MFEYSKIEVVTLWATDKNVLFKTLEEARRPKNWKDKRPTNLFNPTPVQALKIGNDYFRLEKFRVA